MPGTDEARLAAVQQWIAKAENDLINAEHTLTLGEDGPTDTVCFHAQQCVEKYLKALLVYCGIDFYRTHDIGALQALLPLRVQPALTAEQQEQLTDYAVSARYPGDWEVISLAEAHGAVTLARSVRTQARAWLSDALAKGRDLV
jgi:HEPN domain-containing protein